MWGINFICYFDGAMGKKLTTKTRCQHILMFLKSIKDAH